MVRSTIVVPIASNRKIIIKLFNTIGEVLELKKNIDFTKGTTLIDAALHVSGLQTYRSGADLQLQQNGNMLVPTIRWHANEVHQIKKIYDVTALMQDGINDFQMVYSAAFGVLSDQVCLVNAELVLIVNKEDAGDVGVKTGSTVESGILDRFSQKVKEGATVIAVTTFSGAIIAGAIIYLKSRK